MTILALLLAASACATSIDGLKEHLSANKDRYQEMTPKLKQLGLVSIDDKKDIASDVALLGAVKDPRQFAPAPAPSPKPKTALEEAERLGAKSEDVEDIAADSIAEFDPATGKRVVKSEGEMYKAVVEAIASAKCKAPAAAGSFKALLWGAVVLDAMSRNGDKWPEMVDESRRTWDQLARAVAQGREEFAKHGRVGSAGGELPAINYKEQKELGATATWDGNINVGDIFAGLSGAGKNAVLFHEYLHDSDDLTKAGVHDNFWTTRLPEPDKTPSGQNWTETLAYRQMGDWADVLSLPWPKFKE